MWEIEKAILLTNNDRVVEKFGDKAKGYGICGY